MQSYLLVSPQTAPRTALKNPKQGISTSSLTQHVEAKTERNNQILYQTARTLSYIKALANFALLTVVAPVLHNSLCAAVFLSSLLSVLLFCGHTANPFFKDLCIYPSSFSYFIVPLLPPWGFVVKLDLLFDFKKYP